MINSEFLNGYTNKKDSIKRMLEELEKKGIGNESRIRNRNEAMGRELENRTCTGQTSGSYSVRNEECLPSHTEQQSA